MLSINTLISLLFALLFITIYSYRKLRSEYESRHQVHVFEIAILAITLLMLFMWLNSFFIRYNVVINLDGAVRTGQMMLELKSYV